MLVNYRKTGEAFENLLTMAFVHDCHGRRRYCVGLQLDLTGLEGDDGPWGQASLSSDDGQRLIEETRKKYTKLIKLLPQTLPVPAPPTPIANRKAPPVAAPTDGWKCAQLAALANALSKPLPGMIPTSASWIGMLYGILDLTPHAAIVVDMSVPGLPIDYCNEAFATLTQWPADEAMGKNCSFLQDKCTEPEALAQLITALRTYKSAEVHITNVRKDGSQFINGLSLHPIFDTNGACRFFVGILSDMASPQADGSLQTLRRCIPTEPVNADLFPATPPRFAPVAVREQWTQCQPVSAKLIRLLWATDPDGALRQLLAMHPLMSQQAIDAFSAYLQKAGRTDDLALLQKLVEQQRSGAWSPLAGRQANAGA